MSNTDVKTPMPEMRFRSDERRAMFVENQDDLASPETSKNIFGFGNDVLLAQGNDGMHAGLAGHAEDGLKLTEEQLKEKERKRDAAEAFLDGISDLEIKLSELTQRVDTKISFFQGQLAINAQQINNTNLAVADTSQALAHKEISIAVAADTLSDVKEDVQLTSLRAFREADALSMRSYEADLAQERVEQINDDLATGEPVSHIQMFLKQQKAEADARLTAQAEKTDIAVEQRNDALDSLQVAEEDMKKLVDERDKLQVDLEDLQTQLQDLQETRVELGETLEGYEALQKKINDYKESGNINEETLKQLNDEFDALERGEPHTPTINAEIAVASNDPNAPSGTTLETEEIGSTGLTQDELSAQAVQQQLADGTLKTGELAASGVDAKTATQFEGRDLGDNSPLTDTRDGVVEVAQKIDTAVVTAERTGTSASGSEIARKVEVGQALAKAHDHVVPTEPAQTANYNYAPTLQTQTFS
ncbi:MAG: hypothetical protein R3D88_06840 [Alphaproteobacteria bacterium]